MYIHAYNFTHANNGTTALCDLGSKENFARKEEGGIKEGRKEGGGGVEMRGVPSWV